MVLPLMKLGLLAFRTLSKPVANKLKRNAGIHPRFRGFIIDVAQANHRLATNMQRRLIGRATDIHIRPLNEEKAIQAATDLLGELFIFSVACGAIIFEVHRSGKSEARKEEARKKALEEIKEKMEELEREKQMMKLRVAEVERVTGVGGGWPWVLPRAFTSGAAQPEPEPEQAAQQPTAA
ncbi:OPA3-like protein [Triticum urartu]|uniref:OPA3-like protein n=1 Tax=Triticum urartu TaxID=4572 RepID=A0A8R7TY00_TRIUA|nr:OPA3-like protein [Triticum urartu]